MLTLDNDFSQKLMQVLSNPEAMSKITAIASGLGATAPSTKVTEDTDAEAPVQESAPQGTDAIPALLQGINTSPDPRLLLLTSLKPLLREEKRDRIDAITRALALAQAMKGFRK